MSRDHDVIREILRFGFATRERCCSTESGSVETWFINTHHMNAAQAKTT